MPNLHAYQQLQQIIMDCQSVVTATASPDRVNISKAVQAIDDCFRVQILLHTTDDDAPHSIHVEINKQLRLLKTDCLFLRSAQQTTTQDQRLQQMRDRLVLLERYCEMILGDAD
jgi:hypothetical protein